MKISLVAMIMLLCSFTCSKTTSSKARVASGIEGTWQLTSYYMSSGGPGSWYNADPESPQFISFGSDGTLSYEPQSEFGGTRYQLEGDSVLYVFRTTDTIRMYYTVSPTELELKPPCIEGCSQKYKPVNRD